MRKTSLAVVAIGVLMVLTQPLKAAVQLVNNGNFETGTFVGWTVANQAGGSGNWFIDTPGTTTPFSGISTIGSAGNGNFYAVTDQGGPGAHVLLQSFVVPVNTVTLTLTFQLFANDYDGGPIINPAGLTFTSGPNQHARVDILTAGAAAFSTAAVDIVSNHYLGVDAGPDPHGFTTYTANISGLAAGTYQLRFGQVDNQSNFNLGVDNVSILADLQAPVPEPATMTIWGLGALGCAAAAYRRRRKQAA